MKESYKVTYVLEDDSYVFITENQITYEIRLESRKELLEDYPSVNLTLVELAFAPRENQKPVADSKIATTIVEFIKEYFENQQKVMVVIYETLDGKHLAKSLLFNKWLTKNNDQTFMAKVNFSLRMHQGLEVKGLFLFRADHPQHQEILEMVSAIVTDMQSLK